MEAKVPPAFRNFSCTGHSLMSSMLGIPSGSNTSGSESIMIVCVAPSPVFTSTSKERFVPARARIATTRPETFPTVATCPTLVGVGRHGSSFVESFLYTSPRAPPICCCGGWVGYGGKEEGARERNRVRWCTRTPTSGRRADRTEDTRGGSSILFSSFLPALYCPR